jgi:hypothetical protein
MSAIKDGDIFRWRYKDEKPEHLGAYRRYHCKSQIAVAKDGQLVDTFWGGSASDSAWWTYAEAETGLVLTHLGNFSELEKKPEYMAAYYDAADIVNLNHSNSSRDNFYTRKGAQRSKDKMRATLAERIATTEREISFRQDRLERDRQLLADIDSGRELADVHL